MQWMYDHKQKSLVGYGTGATRQIVAQGDIEYYHHNVKTSAHIYAPFINPNQGIFTYQLYKPTDVRETPIMVVGNLIPRPDIVEDRLHLKMVNDIDEFKRKVDTRTITRKYDGASSFVNSNGQGIKLFGPRLSKQTGKPIEYTYKLPEVANLKIEPFTGMGEVLFWRYTPIGKILSFFEIRGPEEICWKYTPSAETGGILNANKPRNLAVHAELRLYRIDRIDGKRTTFAPFFENREYQNRLGKHSKGVIKVVKLVKKPKEEWEGFVGVPPGLSVNEGIKEKFKGDETDMIIKSVNFYVTDKERIGGVVSCEYNGKIYNFGPGQVGDTNLCLEFIDNKDELVGRTAKTVGFVGGVGRAARIVEIHSDK